MNTFIHSLRKSTRSFVFFIGLSLVSSYLLITPSHFPYVGLSLSFAILATLVFFTKTHTSPFVRASYAFCLLFCACLMLRSQEFLTLLNLCAIVFFGALMSIFSTEHTNTLGFAKFLTAPFRAIAGMFKTNAEFDKPRELSREVFSSVSRIKWEKHVKSLLLSLVILMVIIPLLASANPLFSSWVESFLNIFDLSFLSELLKIENVSLWVIRILVAALFFMMIPRFIRFSEKGEPLREVLHLPFRDLLIPKVVVSVVLCIFFVSQAQLYFSSADTLAALGYSHSSYAREVFGQLSLVALIVVGLIYNDRNSQKIDRILTYVLLIEAFFLGGIALKSVNDYSLTWGLTHKRLWGFTGVFWLFITLAIFSAMHFERKHFSAFVKSIVLLSGMTLLVVNVLNFDYLIFHFGKSTTERGTDYDYLSELSSDSLSYSEQFQTFSQMEMNADTATTPQYRIGSSARLLSRKIKVLKEKYDKPDLRTFNLSEFRQYLDVRNIDTTQYDEKWKLVVPTDSKHYPPVQTKHINQFDRFPLKSDLPTLYPYVTYYYIVGSGPASVSRSRETIFNEARFASDIWNQAGIDMTIATEALTVSAADVSALQRNEISFLPSRINPRLKTLPIFVVGEGISTAMMPGGGEYLVLNERIFTNKDGRALAQTIGYAFGLSIIPQSQTDQKMISGLMGNVGYFDISDVDIIKARERAKTFEARVNQ